MQIGLAAVVRPAVIARQVVNSFQPLNPLVVPNVQCRNMVVGVVGGAGVKLDLAAARRLPGFFPTQR